MREEDRASAPRGKHIASQGNECTLFGSYPGYRKRLVKPRLSYRRPIMPMLHGSLSLDFSSFFFHEVALDWSRVEIP